MGTKLYPSVMNVETQLFLGRLKLELIGASHCTRDPYLIAQLLDKAATIDWLLNDEHWKAS